MPKRRFNEEQIAFALRQADAGTTVGEICRKMGVAEATFYRWKKGYAGRGVSEIPTAIWRFSVSLGEENAILLRRNSCNGLPSAMKVLFHAIEASLYAISSQPDQQFVYCVYKYAYVL